MPHSKSLLEKMKEQRNNLLQQLFLLKKDAQTVSINNNLTFHHKPKSDPILEKILALDVIDTPLIKEHIVSFLKYLNSDDIKAICNSEAGSQRRTAINNIIKKQMETSNDSNTKNLHLIFKERISPRTKFFYIFFDSLSSNDYNILDKEIKFDNLEDFVEGKFNKIIDLLVENS